MSAEFAPAAPGKRRVLITLTYDGTAYAGWQRQKNGLAVQEVLEKALQKALGARTPITGASRTDAGVHALGQAAHFDTDAQIPPDKYPFVFNALLPSDIRVLTGRAVPPDFHARFSAIGKRYAYRVHNAPTASALLRNMSAHVPQRLDIQAMRAACETLPGTHDFAAFQAAGGTAKTTVRTLSAATLCLSGQDVLLRVEGDAFLYNMVRIIAGTLIDIGKGKRGADAFEAAFRTLSRLSLGATAPARGLLLDAVHYPGFSTNAAPF